MTCGTSLITNSIKQCLRTTIGSCANMTNWEEMHSKDAAILKQHLQNRGQQLLLANDSEVCKLSAELNGLLAWQEANPTQSEHKQNEYWLIATDTVLGQATAQMIQRWLEQQGYFTQIISESGLKTAHLSEFRQALSALTKQIIEAIKGYQDSGYHINFNLTGGFKGINGFLQAVATVYADQTYYLFEGSGALLYIPKLPYQLNAEPIIQTNLTAFRRLAKDLPVNEAQSYAIPEMWLFEIDDIYTLSEWGTLIWQDTMPELYRREILTSPSDNITISSQFIDSCKKAKPELVSLINKRIDDLAVYLEGGSQHMLKSLDVKALQTQQYKNQDMHECDLDAHHRIFMVKNGQHMTLKMLHDALH